MARENLGQILIDAEVVSDIAELRRLLAGGHVRQGERVLRDRNEKIDTKDGPVIVGEAVRIFEWLDHSVS
jgi:hypothetical protein